MFPELPDGHSGAEPAGRAYVVLGGQRLSAALAVSVSTFIAREYGPGSEFFVVYTEGRSTLPAHGTDLQSRGVVIKINRLFRY